MKNNLFISITLSFLSIIGFTTNFYAQQNGFYFRLSSGWSVPIKTYAFHGASSDSLHLAFPVERSGYFFERISSMAYALETGYTFGKIKTGLIFSASAHHEVRFDWCSVCDKTEKEAFVSDFPHRTEGGASKLGRLGLLVAYPVFTGRKFSVDAVMQTGMLRMQIDALKNFYSGDDLPHEVLLYSLDFENDTKQMPYVSFGFDLNYQISPHLGVFLRTGALTALGKGLTGNVSYYPAIDLNRDGKINESDVTRFVNIDNLKTEVVEIKPEVLYIGAGITLKPFRKTKSRKKTSFEKIDKPLTKRERKKDSRCEIKLTAPAQGTVFDQEKEWKDIRLRWKAKSSSSRPLQFLVEVRNLRTQRSYTARTQKDEIKLGDIFGRDFPSGTYSWRVTELNCGITSEGRTFYRNTCDVNMSVDSVQVECAGYEGNDRKYKVCFTVQYQSSVGPLTYNSPGSGLMVYDQNYSALNYQLVSPNPVLVQQPGNPASTVTYCFETTVTGNVSAIGFGLQGDDLDPSPLQCVPGAGEMINDLPECICKSCDSLVINASDLQVTPSGNAFVLGGNLQVNQPVYGIELQFVSMNYSAVPPTCSPGVGDVSESGVFVKPGTTVNNSGQVQFLNESASADPNSNNNVSKNIKYTSTTPLTGNIPLQVVLGLPVPLSGLASGCCRMEYEVCIKISVYYEDGSCKTCSVTECFQFNNQ